MEKRGEMNYEGILLAMQILHLRLCEQKTKMHKMSNVPLRFIPMRLSNGQMRQENEKIIENKCTDCELVNLQTRKIDTLTNENEQLRQEIVHLKDDLQYYKTKSARLEEELLSTRGCMYE